MRLGSVLSSPHNMCTFEPAEPMSFLVQERRLEGEKQLERIQALERVSACSGPATVIRDVSDSQCVCVCVCFFWMGIAHSGRRVNLDPSAPPPNGRWRLQTTRQRHKAGSSHLSEPNKLLHARPLTKPLCPRSGSASHSRRYAVKVCLQ